jgi:MFS family permease
MFAVVFITTAVLTFAALVALFPAALAPELAPALGVQPALVGFQVSLVYVGAMLTSLIGGSLTRRSGPCRASQLSLLMLAGGAALAAVANVWTFALASLMIGFGYGMTNPAASTLLVRFTPARRSGLIFSIKQSGIPLGGVLAGALAPALALLVGWQGAMLALTAMAVLGIMLLQPLRQRWDQERQRTAGWVNLPLAGVRLVIALPVLRYLSLVGMCFSGVQLALSAFTVTLLVEELQFGLVQAGLTMSAVQIAGVCGRVLWGWVADRISSGLFALTLVGSITTLAALATSLMAPTWPLEATVTVLCVFGSAALGWNGVYLAEVARRAPQGHVADASGGSLFFTYGGVVLGLPAFVGLHALLGSYTISFAVIAGLAALGLAFARLARRAVDASAVAAVEVEPN